MFQYEIFQQLKSDLPRYDIVVNSFIQGQIFVLLRIQVIHSVANCIRIKSFNLIVRFFQFKCP